MNNRINKSKLALILGSGFSKEAGLPTTKELSSNFLDIPENSVLDSELERCISDILKLFWRDVFGYQDGSNVPSLEDHFTLLDLAANTGHYLGEKYTPKKLRAIRRMSIHRVFQILDKRIELDGLSSFMKTIDEKFNLSILTLNWDIVVERLSSAHRGINYGIKIGELDDSFEKPDGIMLLKLHGSSNWIYCDNCHRIYAGAEKSALLKKVFIEKGDLELFCKISHDNSDRECRFCNNKQIGARVATFSYRKAFSINQFQTLWDLGHTALREADHWLFIGYSLPEADFEFKHLLKSAQLARKNGHYPTINVIMLGDCTAEKRYQSLFGHIVQEGIYQDGLKSWIETKLAPYLIKFARIN